MLGSLRSTGSVTWRSVTSPSIVAVSTAHRADAFAACRRLIDEIKAEVPIWKHQRFADGRTEWVGSTPWPTGRSAPSDAATYPGLVTVLYWLVVPLLVTALAAVWVAFAHRSRPPADPRDSMAEHERFRRAMERPAPPTRAHVRPPPESPTSRALSA